MLVVIALPDPKLKGVLAELKNEMLLLLLILAVMVVIVKIAYYREGFISVIRTAASLYWLFVLPGYSLMLYWRKNLGFTERIIMGTVASMALSGLLSYYLGLVGLKIQNQTILLPLVITAFSFAAALKSWAGKGSEQPQG